MTESEECVGESRLPGGSKNFVGAFTALGGSAAQASRLQLLLRVGGHVRSTWFKSKRLDLLFNLAVGSHESLLSLPAHPLAFKC